MKRLILPLLAMIFTAGCDKQPPADLELTGTVVKFKVTTVSTRSGINYNAAKYFGLGEGYQVATVNIGEAPVSYTYNDGILTPTSEALIFPRDGGNIQQITVSWPDELRRVSQPVGGVAKDQSSAEVFFATDWLKATLNNVVPSEMIPVSLDHERCKITFEIAGEQTGKRIKSLTIGDYIAYCDSSLDQAQLIYDLRYDLGSIPTGTTGKVEVEGIDGVIDIMIIDSPDEMLKKPGDNCTVKLNL